MSVFYASRSPISFSIDFWGSNNRFLFKFQLQVSHYVFYALLSFRYPVFYDLQPWITFSLRNMKSHSHFLCLSTSTLVFCLFFSLVYVFFVFFLSHTIIFFSIFLYYFMYLIFFVISIFTFIIFVNFPIFFNIFRFLYLFSLFFLFYLPISLPLFVFIIPSFKSFLNIISFLIFSFITFLPMSIFTTPYSSFLFFHSSFQYIPSFHSYLSQLSQILSISLS